MFYALTDAKKNHDGKSRAVEVIYQKKALKKLLFIIESIIFLITIPDSLICYVIQYLSD